MTRKIGIIDEPVRDNEEDNLDIGTHAKSLIQYIKDTDTPITIGIQGEWGSGKTSLINSIFTELDKDNKYKQIWINSWEFSLLTSPEESLLKIVSKIIDELVKSDESIKKSSDLGNAAKKVFEGALRIGAGVVGGTSGQKVAEELFEESHKQNITELRKQLRDLVSKVKDSNQQQYQKVIIYVDDLDRIEPKNAVSILELLKNIFNVPNCVFVLAIDYQVVVKGLEHKFGKQTSENEWEFRAFFDKIIQLPFMMPMGQYNIAKYVNKLLREIGFIDEKGLDEDLIRRIIEYTIGRNPRSIKRLINSVSLIQVFTEIKKADEPNNIIGELDDLENPDDKQKFLLFSLVCLQIAYPHIYSLLEAKPNFTEWDDSFAHSDTMQKEKNKEEYPQFDEEFEIAKNTDDFNEPWEQALYRICYVRPRMKNIAKLISKFFSIIKDDLLNGNEALIEELIIETLRNTSVTSVTSTDKQQIVIPERAGAFQRRMFDDIETYFQKEREESKHPGVDSTFDLIRQIHTDISEKYPNAEWKYAGGVTGYSSKHKFISIYNHGNNGVHVRLLRHKDDDYKIPKNADIAGSCIREYQVGKDSTAFESYNYYFDLTDDLYTKAKDIIMNLIAKSLDMCDNHYQNKLSVMPRKPSFSCIIDGEEKEYKQKKKVDEMALKYLNNSYTYNLK